MNADPTTGAVVESPSGFDILTLDIAALDEDWLAQWAPTPRQVAGALVISRAKNLAAPKALDRYRRELRKAERNKAIALGLAISDLRKEFGSRLTMTELKELAIGTNERLIAAMDAYDEAWLMFEYAKDFADAIKTDVTLIQSIAKSQKGEGE